MEATLYHGPSSAFEIGKRKFGRTSRGWDTMRCRYLLPAAARDADLLNGFDPTAIYKKGTAHPDYNKMFVCEVDGDDAGYDPDHAGSVEINVLYKGILKPNASASTTKGYDVRWSTLGQTLSAENITSPAGTGKHEVIEPVFIGEMWDVTATLPNPNLIGTANTPPVAQPNVPSNRWASLADPVLVYPYGWVLEGMEIDELPREPSQSRPAIYFVHYTFAYRQPVKPGDI